MLGTSDRRPFVNTLPLCLLAMMAISCSNAERGSEKGADVANPVDQCALRSPTAGEWFSDELSVTVIGKYGHRLHLDRLRFVSVQAQDADGEILATKVETRPDSKFGPMASILVSPARTSKQRIVVQARIEYEGQPVALQAEFVQENGKAWKATDVALKCVE